MKHYAFVHADGSVSIAHTGNVKRLCEASEFASPVVECHEVTIDQAAAIRDARPKPEYQANSAPVSGVDIAELRAVEAKLLEMQEELADFRQFKAGLSRAIEEKKAQI